MEGADPREPSGRGRSEGAEQKWPIPTRRSGRSEGAERRRADPNEMERKGRIRCGRGEEGRSEGVEPKGPIQEGEQKGADPRE